MDTYYYVLDMVENCYHLDNVRERITLICRNHLHELCMIHVVNIPHEMYVEWNSNSREIPTMFVDDLEQCISKRLERAPCFRTMCRVCGNHAATTQREEIVDATAVVAAEEEEEEDEYSQDEEEGGAQQKQWMSSREMCASDRRRLFDRAITHTEFVERRGFSTYEAKPRMFLKCTLDSAFAAGYIADELEKREIGTYEVRPKTMDSFLALSGCHTGSYVKVDVGTTGEVDYKNVQFLSNNEYVSAADMVKTSSEAADDDDGMLVINKSSSSYMLKTMTIDIETIAERYVNHESDRALYPIGVIACKMAQDKDVTTFSWKPWELGDNGERNMLQAFISHFQQCDPDVISGYNSNSFDIPYLLRRAKRLGVSFPLSRLINEHVFLDRTQDRLGLSRIMVTCPGRMMLDIYPLTRKEFRLDSYKLGDVAKELKLSEQKIEDVHYKEIYRHFHSQELHPLLVKYCAQDVRVSECLGIKKMDSVRRTIAKCRVLLLRAQDALDRGLGYNLSFLVKRGLVQKGFLNRRLKPNVLDPKLKLVKGYEALWTEKMNGKKYPGAFVFEPKKGFIRDDPVAVFDFNSLYPSILQTFNICRSTTLTVDDLTRHRQEGIPFWTSPCGYSYTKSCEGVLPGIARMLVDERKRVRARLATETDEDMKAALDAEQNEIKIAANSLYGLLGTTTSPISLLSGAYSITAWGAEKIKEVCTRVEREFPFCEVVYGDTDSLFVRMNVSSSPSSSSSVPPTTSSSSAISSSSSSVLTTEWKDIPTKGWVMAKTIHDWINVGSGMMHGCLKMGLESVTWPTLLLKKKHYVMNVWSESNVSKFKQKGMLTRQLTPFVRQFLETFLKRAVCQLESPLELYGFVIDQLNLVMSGTLDRTLFLRSKCLSRALHMYRPEAKDQHVVAARQLLKERGLVIQPGERVAFYLCNVPVPPSKSKSSLISNYVVAAELAHDKPLCWKLYQKEIIGKLECCGGELLLTQAYFKQICADSSMTNGNGGVGGKYVSRKRTPIDISSFFKKKQQLVVDDK